MKKKIMVGIIGEYDPNSKSHVITNQSLAHAAAELSVTVEPVWIPIHLVHRENVATTLNGFDGLWSPPGEYKDVESAIRAIQFVREEQWPFIGT